MKSWCLRFASLALGLLLAGCASGARGSAGKSDLVATAIRGPAHDAGWTVMLPGENL